MQGMAGAFSSAIVRRHPPSQPSPTRGEGALSSIRLCRSLWLSGPGHFVAVLVRLSIALVGRFHGVFVGFFVLVEILVVEVLVVFVVGVLVSFRFVTGGLGLRTAFGTAQGFGLVGFVGWLGLRIVLVPLGQHIGDVAVLVLFLGHRRAVRQALSAQGRDGGARIEQAGRLQFLDARQGIAALDRKSVV